jgi:hypothetical protein
MADTFFYGHAYLDANGNGEIDEDDPGLKGALFDVALGSGMSNQGTTNEEGRAWVIIPGGAGKDDWPVRARMRPPPDSGYTLIGPAEVVLAHRETSADFLFAEPEPAIMADTFFYGHAYLDANGNGEIDEDDPGLKGALFDVALGSGMGNQGTTNEEGQAWVIIPGGADKDDWPVRARMRPPPDSGYTLIGPAEVVLAHRETSADFLFAEPTGGE